MSDTTTAPGPVEPAALGNVPLKDIPGFPPAVAARLADVFAVATLLDLEPFVREAPAGSIPPAGPIRYAFDLLNLKGVELDQAVWTVLRQITARFDPPSPERSERARKPKAVAQDPAGSPARARIPTPDLDRALREILRWDTTDPCSDDQILAALEREWATPVQGVHPPGSDPCRGVMWSARVHPTLRRAEFRYGCGPNESPTPTLCGAELVAAVRRVFQIPYPEANRGEDRPSEPVHLPGVPEVGADHQPEQRDDAVRGAVPAVQEAGELLGDVPHEHVPDHGDARVLPADPGGVRRPRRGAAGVRARWGDAVQADRGVPAHPGVGPTVHEPRVGDGVHGGDLRPATSAVVSPARADDFTEDTPPPRRRPRNDPVTGFVTLGPGESLVGTFWQWDQAGRIPLGSLLCEGVHQLGKFCGWKLHAPPYTNLPPGLVPAGEMIPAEFIEKYEQRAVVMIKGEKGRYHIMIPKV